MLDNTFNPIFNKARWVYLVETRWRVFAAAAFLVAVPVFIEAPLVRSWPWLSVALTGFWVGLSYFLYRKPQTKIWGDLLFGFSWSWLAGAIYWGWWRWFPAVHLPIESIGLPIVIWCCWQGVSKVGSLFYLGSLVGTATTDAYFYLTDLVSYWQQLMITEPTLARPILQAAVLQVRSPNGITWATILVCFLLGLGIICLNNKKSHWYAFSGAILTTIVVDSLFLILANINQTL